MENYTNQNKNIAYWLFICCLMIFSMVIIGGLTRLTDSGLSMTSWHPINGFLPPLNIEQWFIEFNNYRLSPEYININYGMTLNEFKQIFWLEYIHRVFGRITGIIFFLPLFIFIIRKKIFGKNLFYLLCILFLGAAQGIVGWYMVKSGLKDQPHVSPYWLAFHLGNAFIIFSFVFLLALKNLPSIEKHKSVVTKNIRISFQIFLFLLFIQIILGGFVAGNNAGLIYNTYPLMDGNLIPSGLFIKDSIFANLFENITTIQFNHRLLAHILVFYYFILFLFSFKISLTKPVLYAIRLVCGIILLQFLSGILTLLWNVPVAMASIHQSLAFVLFATTLFINFMIKKNNG